MRSTRRKSLCHPSFDVLEHRYAPATLNVTTPLDVVDGGDGLLSLREAINDANATAEVDLILLPAGKFKIRIPDNSDDANATGDFDITNPVNFRGVDAVSTIIDGNRLDRVFHIHGPAAGGFPVTIRRLTIQNGFSSDDDGGGIFVDDESTSTFSNLTLRRVNLLDNYADDDGGAVGFRGAGNLTMIQSVASRNSAFSGGAINTETSNGLRGNINATDCTFSDNLADGDGGAFNAAGDVILTNTTVTGNSAGTGGGFESEGGAAEVITLVNSTVTNNSADGDGGGIRASAAPIALTDSSVSGNFSNSFGGGIRTTGDITLTRSSILDNVAGLDGGGIVVFGSGAVTLTDSSVRGNHSGGQGGGIRGGGSGTVALLNSTVSDNISLELGGGIATFSADVTLTDSTVSGNLSNGAGGGISTDSGGVTLTNSTVSANRGGTTNFDGGGGVFTITGNVTVTLSTICDNRSTSDGGGIFAGDGSTITMDQSTICNNTSLSSGGGIFTEGDLLVTNSTINGNRADRDGGGIAVDTASDTVNLTNVTVSGNVAADAGGGISFDLSGTATLVNVTVVRNAAETTGGVSGSSVGTVSVMNSLIARNRVATDEQVEADISSFFTSLGNNLIGIGDGGTGFADGTNGDKVGTEVAPLKPRIFALADNGGPTKTHALRLNSTAIDAGNNTGTPATDQRGLARISDGDLDTIATVDIGAFEL